MLCLRYNIIRCENQDIKDRRKNMKVITFGEIMMRLNPEGYRRFVQAERFEASYSGVVLPVDAGFAAYSGV